LPFLGIGIASVLSLLVNPYVGMFLIGLTLGAVLRIVAYARFTVMGWPVIERVLDWGRVESLLREEAQPGASPNGGPAEPLGNSGVGGGPSLVS
jgi:hypothetical protein